MKSAALLCVACVIGWTGTAAAQRIRPENAARPGAMPRELPGPGKARPRPFEQAMPGIGQAPRFPQPQPWLVAREVDALLTREVHAGGEIERAPLVNDETFLRRVWLDVVGRNPSPEEVNAFLRNPDPGKRARMVDRLLADSRYGENWAGYWRDAILYRRSEDRALLVAPPLRDFLQEEFNRNSPWSEIVTALITAEGDVRENGATGLIMSQGGKPEETTAEVARLFLGIQLQCAQCHDHPTDRWERETFHELAAFFPRVAVRPITGGMTRSFEVAATDNALARPVNSANRFRGTLEHFMPDLDRPEAVGKRMQPVFFLTGERLEFGTPDATRRSKLAEWITAVDNPWFARAFVNRIWAEMLGEGFYEPVDDIGPEREASAPETMDYLAVAFVESGYDVKWLFRTIAATEAYQRESRPRRDPDAAPFVANCSQRLRADQIYNNLQALLNLPQPSLPSRAPLAFVRSPQFVFSQMFGFDPSDPRDEVSGSIPQALMMMNSPALYGPMQAGPGAMLGRLLGELESDRDVVVELYLRVLARNPSDQELQKCLAYREEVGQRSEAFEDILWSLVNSTEFLHRK